MAKHDDTKYPPVGRYGGDIIWSIEFDYLWSQLTDSSAIPKPPCNHACNPQTLKRTEHILDSSNTTKTTFQHQYTIPRVVFAGDGQVACLECLLELVNKKL